MRTASRNSGHCRAGQVRSYWLLVPGVSFGPKQDYLYAGDRLAVQLDWSEGELPVRQYVAVDHLNSTRAIVDDNGNLEEIDYLPFGGFLTGDPVPDTTHLFTGHERDTAELASNLDYMHARYFSPNLGRFLSVDSVGGKLGSSQSWNRYTYAWANPIRIVDPDGLYGRDVHEYLTRYLATAAGRAVEARGLGAADQGVDGRATTSLRFWNLRNFGLHFMGRDQALAFFGAAADKGAALHSVQDSFAHRGYGWPFGHALANLLGVSPDDTWRDIDKAMEMAALTFELLGGESGDLDTTFLRLMFGVRSEQDRASMLEEAERRIRGEEPENLTIRVKGRDQALGLASYYQKEGYTVYIDGVLYQ